MKHLLGILVIIYLVGCSDKKKIEITTEYIINPHWDRLANAIKINKMRLKQDSVLDLAHLNQADILDRLEQDSSFFYVANAKIAPDEDYASKKIYFNKDNGFPWWRRGGNSAVKTVGNLERGNWYKFSHLVTYPYYVYIYIDSVNNVHRFDVNLGNY